MERREDRSPDVVRAAQRLARPRARVLLALKRLLDVVLALVMLIALAPVLVVVLALRASAGGGWVEERVRLGRDGRPVILTRFRALSGGAVGRALERVGARDLPLLLAVLRGRLSFVGPRAVCPVEGAGRSGPRRLMTPGLVGPAQRLPLDSAEADACDDAYVAHWSLWRDALLLVGRTPRVVAHQRVSKTSS